MSCKLVALVKNNFHARLLVSNAMRTIQSDITHNCKLFWEIRNTNLGFISSVHTSCYLNSEEIKNDNIGKPSIPKAKIELTSHPSRIVWPSLWKSIGNWITATFIVTPYFDPEFNLKDFMKGAKQALVVVANQLSQGNLEKLEELVEHSTLTEIEKNLSLLNAEQKHLLSVDAGDIYLSFPYQVGVIINDKDNGVQERFVEIAVCYHILRGLAELQKREDFEQGPNAVQKYHDRIMICNYRFNREFTKGVQGQWVINLINHFQPTVDND